MLFCDGICKFFVYYFFGYFYLWGPIWIVYLQQRRNFTLTQASLLDAIFLISVAFSEIPTGVVADALGRKAIVVAGGALFTISLILYGLSASFVLLILVSVMRATAVSLISGAENALLYDVLLEQHREEEYTNISGKLMATKQISLALAAIFGGLIATVNLSLPFYLTAIMTAIGLMAVASIHLKVRNPTLTISRHTRRYREITSSALHAITHNTIIAYILFILCYNNTYTHICLSCNSITTVCNITRCFGILSRRNCCFISFSQYTRFFFFWILYETNGEIKHIIDFARNYYLFLGSCYAYSISDWHLVIHFCWDNCCRHPTHC